MPVGQAGDPAGAFRRGGSGAAVGTRRSAHLGPGPRNRPPARCAAGPIAL